MIVSLVVALALSAPVTDSTPPAAPATPPAAAAPPPAAPPAAQAPAATPPAQPPMAPPPSAPPAVIPPAPPSLPPAPPSVPPAPPVAPVAPVAASLAAPPPASPPRRTSFPPAHSFHLALGLGVAMASGNASQHVAMSELTAEQFDSLFEIGVRFAQRFYLDAYAELGQGDGGRALSDCKSCSASRANLGLEAKYAFVPTGRFNPWIGIGGGIEGMSLDISYESPSTTRTSYILANYRGVELPRLSAGVDWRISRIIGVGLFANFSFVRYTSVRTAFVGTQGISGEHTWFTLGARGILFP